METDSHPRPGAKVSGAARPAIDEPGIQGLLRMFGVDPSDLQIRVHLLADGSEFAKGDFLVTVVKRRFFVSRTYLGGSRGDWICEFLEDARAGLFGEIIGPEAQGPDAQRQDTALKRAPAP